MQSTDQSAEKLHQQASAHYLQGKFAEALAVWRQLLAADPEDERAKEGVRLCALLTDDVVVEEVVAAPAAAVDAAVPAEPVAPVAEVQVEPADAIEFEVPELDLDLPALDAAEPAVAAEPGAVSQAPDPDRQAEGMQLGNEPDALGLAGEVPPEFELATPEDFGAMPADGDGEIVDAVIPEADVEFAAAAPAPADPAEAELKKRIDDLMQEAMAAYSAGDNDAVRAVLARVFILDEAYPEAHQLQELIEEGVPAETEHVSVADLDAPDHDAAPGQFDLDSDNPEAVAGTVAPTPVPVPDDAIPDFDLPDVSDQSSALDMPESTDALQLDPIETVPEAPPADDVAPLPDFNDDDVAAAPVEAAAPSQGKRIRLPQLDVVNSKTRMIVGVVVVLIVVVVGAGFWMKLRDTSIRDEASPLPALQAEAESVDPAAAAPAEVPSEAAPEEPAAPAANAAVDVQALMADGRAAMDSGDYAAAMVAFHAVIEAEPGHVNAVERLQAATDGYKRKQEADKQWLAAAGLFRDGEYRSAMKMFYRLEPSTDEDVARLNRYKTNGWYNMAVVALRSGHCDLARSHLLEAEQLAPEDVDVATAQALADSCDAGSRRSGYQRAIQVIQLRGLDG